MTTDLSQRLSEVLSRLELIDWFSRVGQRADELDRSRVKAYLRALGCAGFKIKFVNDLDAVKTCTKEIYDPSWLAIEDNFRFQLTDSVDLSELDVINRSLRTVIDPMSERVMQAAKNKLATDDLQILKVAAGSAIEACYQYALEFALSSTSQGVFDSKITIFAQGRWPLTTAEERFHVY